MMTPMMGNRVPEDRVWAADTGCFAAPHKYTDAWYLTWLGKWREVSDRCLFATAPDVVGDAAATLKKSVPVLPMIREAGYSPAYVAQDGFDAAVIPWTEFDCLFIGGSTSWKLSDEADDAIATAKGKGKHVHIGRVNSYRRLLHFRRAGADSADGTFVAFGPDANIPKLQSWLDRLAMQPDLFAVNG